MIKTKNPAKLGDTCEHCNWLVRGDTQTTGEHKGLTSWGCRFYHISLGFHKEIPTRLNHCDIDGRITQKLYNKKRNQNDQNKV